MMNYAPFIENDTLYLPEITLNALIPHGLDLQTAATVRHGLTASDRELVMLLVRALEEYRRYAPDSDIARQIEPRQFEQILRQVFA
ncbi:MAG: hypothetical protein AAF653_05705 [Chloroflexota bacterium]